jgi:dihydrolipoamide dehydrogenase
MLLPVTSWQSLHLYSIQVDPIIVTTGSVPFFPSKLKPDGQRVLAPRFASKLNPLPKSAV